MNIQEIRTLYDKWMRREADFAGMQCQDVPPIVRYVNQIVPRSMIRYSDMTQANVDKTIQREIGFFTDIGHKFEWTVYDYDQPADLQARLQAHGFEIGEVEVILVLDITNLPEKLQRSYSHDIREITDPDAVNPILNTVQNIVFEEEIDGALNHHLIEAMRQNASDYQVFAAYVDDKPVSAAWSEYHVEGNPFTGLYGGATLEAHRGKGLYSALIAARAKAALQRGVRYLTVDASPMSSPILQRNGFQQIALSWACDYQQSESRET